MNQNGVKLITFKDVKRSLIMAAWFMVLTFPIMVIKVNTVNDTVEWRWINMLIVGIATFIFSHVWKLMIDRKEGRSAASEKTESADAKLTLRERMDQKPVIAKTGRLAILALAILFPVITGMYQTVS